MTAPATESSTMSGSPTSKRRRTGRPRDGGAVPRRDLFLSYSSGGGPVQTGDEAASVYVGALVAGEERSQSAVAEATDVSRITIQQRGRPCCRQPRWKRRAGNAEIVSTPVRFGLCSAAISTTTIRVEEMMSPSAARTCGTTSISSGSWPRSSRISLMRRPPVSVSGETTSVSNCGSVAIPVGSVSSRTSHSRSRRWRAPRVRRRVRIPFAERANVALVVACLRREVVAGEANCHVPEFECAFEQRAVSVVNRVERSPQRDIHIPGNGTGRFRNIDL